MICIFGANEKRQSNINRCEMINEMNACELPSIDRQFAQNNFDVIRLIWVCFVFGQWTQCTQCLLENWTLFIQFKSEQYEHWTSDTCWIIFIYRGELMLWHGTSRLWPNNSWFRSTIPHGAIPILTTRPVRCCPSNNNASPTCFVTPEKCTHTHTTI